MPVPAPTGPGPLHRPAGSPGRQSDRPAGMALSFWMTVTAVSPGMAVLIVNPRYQSWMPVLDASPGCQSVPDASAGCRARPSVRTVTPAAGPGCQPLASARPSGPSQAAWNVSRGHQSSPPFGLSVLTFGPDCQSRLSAAEPVPVPSPRRHSVPATAQSLTVGPGGAYRLPLGPGCHSVPAASQP